MRAAFTMRSIVPMLALALMVVTTATGLACDKSFVLINRSDKTIVGFFTSPHQSDRWEDNILGNDALDPNEKYGIDMSKDDRDDRLYDVKAVFDDGTKVVSVRLNLCRIADIAVYDHKVTYRNGQ